MQLPSVPAHGRPIPRSWLSSTASVRSSSPFAPPMSSTRAPTSSVLRTAGLSSPRTPP
ncbi:hypothetical protein OH77DRAFT_431730 [Trametes cingulata]|nr:hypothetical protein OH77DRAFT_431730 [Trametes cingulata]